MLNNLIKRSKLYQLAAKAYHSFKSQKHLANAGTRFYCPGCKKYWQSFKPFPPQWMQELADSGWPYKMEDAETLNYENYSCHGCGITDRDRLYIIFLEKMLDRHKEYRILEFAPRPALSHFLRSMSNIMHRTSDLFMGDVDDKQDIQDLYLYNDNSFDVFICSHILEHVTDDIKATKELYRILNPGGFGIVMVPILAPVIATKEDPSITDENLRLKYFGQADHVRLYAKQDFIERLRSVGFKVKLYGVDFFGEVIFERSGITEKSVLYVVEK
jgi:predicted SAM-dependent methyltransferase